jgi:hypothetical protein
MKAPEDIVWDEITESAKARFDYREFEGRFAAIGDSNVAENALFIIIAGYADGKSDDAITGELKTQFALLGFGLPQSAFAGFLDGMKAKLEGEIRATEKALAAFEMGLKPPGVLAQTRSILSR